MRRLSPTIPQALQATRRAPERAGPPGFTLVEIMIVVAILGLVLAMGAPGFVQVMRKEPLRQAVADVTEILGHARASAILRGISTQARFYGDGLMTVDLLPVTRRLSAMPDDPVGSGPAMDGGMSEPLLVRYLNPDIAVTLLEVNLRSQMDQPVAGVRFHANGTSDDFTIILESRGGVRKISLDPITGLAELEVLR